MCFRDNGTLATYFCVSGMREVATQNQRSCHTDVISTSDVTNTKIGLILGPAHVFTEGDSHKDTATEGCDVDLGVLIGTRMVSMEVVGGFMNTLLRLNIHVWPGIRLCCVE